MVSNIKISVLGGDRRQIYALARLAKKSREIAVCGIPAETVRLVDAGNSEIYFFNDPEKAVRGASVILLPFPASPDGVRINAPLDNDATLSDFKLSKLIHVVDDGSLIVGGKLPSTFLSGASDKGLHVVDLLCSESFELKNAYITAEAALSVAMNSLSKNIHGSRIAVSGFGRISKHLCRLLYALGASVTVAARRESDLAFAESLGYSTVRIDEKNALWNAPLLSGYDIIFNTVPSIIFDRDFLMSADKKTLFVELASLPGGFDIPAAQEAGINISWALSLPGKYAPESAGKIIADSVEALISEEVEKQ